MRCSPYPFEISTKVTQTMNSNLVEDLPKEELPRLEGMDLREDDLHFLHLRSLFLALREAALFARGDLLDIGCGNKPYRKLFEGRITSYTGADLCQSSLKCVDIVCEAANIPVADGTYSTVLSTQTLEHVPDPQKLCNEAFRVLVRGGHFILSCPQYWPLHEEPFDFFRFTKYGILRILHSAGFEVISQKANGGKWTLCGQAILLALHNGASKKSRNRILITVANKIFLFLDERFYDDRDTINYVTVARKP